MNFLIGGFDADRGSTLSSFIGLKSALPRKDKWHVSGMVSPFLENATVEGPVTKRLGAKGKARQGITSAFTFQSGHWESFRQFSYPSAMPDEEQFLIPYFGEAVNNLKMRDYIRLDVGYFRNWESASGKLKYGLQVGVFNLLNRHNPFLVMYDDDSEQWMELSLILIMPDLSLRMEF